MATAETPISRGPWGPWQAYTIPFALFFILTAIEGIESLQSAYPWVYTAKILIIVASMVYFCRDWPRFESRGLLWGVAFGVLGLFLWVGISSLGVEAWLVERFPRLGEILGTRAGYNPWEQIASPAGVWAFVITRMIGLSIVVPIIEELFWRGFLMRYLIEEDFAKVPIGTFTPMSFLVVTLLFALVHPEVLAALAWGAGINVLLYQTRNLWACVAAHMVTNFLLGVYVIGWGQWHYW